MWCWVVIEGPLRPNISLLGYALLAWCLNQFECCNCHARGREEKKKKPATEIRTHNDRNLAFVLITESVSWKGFSVETRCLSANLKSHTECSCCWMDILVIVIHPVHVFFLKVTNSIFPHKASYLILSLQLLAITDALLFVRGQKQASCFLILRGGPSSWLEVRHYPGRSSSGALSDITQGWFPKLYFLK